MPQYEIFAIECATHRLEHVAFTRGHGPIIIHATTLTRYLAITKTFDSSSACRSSGAGDNNANASSSSAMDASSLLWSTHRGMLLFSFIWEKCSTIANGQTFPKVTHDMKTRCQLKTSQLKRYYCVTNTLFLIMISCSIHVKLGKSCEVFG